MNMLITRQDKMDSQDAKALGIGLSEYKDAKAMIMASHRTISKSTIMEMVRNMRINAQLCVKL